MSTILQSNSASSSIMQTNAYSSVIQLDMDGNVLMYDRNATFANTKSQAKEILGSVEKISFDELLIGDSVNKRAIIIKESTNSTSNLITWTYESDRYIVDCHKAYSDDITISINNDSINPSTLYVPQNKTVIWENNSSSPVSIYSGTTTYDDFQLDPDLNLFGTVFSSSVLQPGERYSYKFVSVGDFNWFTYPDILTGSISVAKNQLFSQDYIVILESDGLESPFTSRVIKVDTWGNVAWSFGEGYLAKPRDARPLLNGGVLIST